MKIGAEQRTTGSIGLPKKKKRGKRETGKRRSCFRAGSVQLVGIGTDLHFDSNFSSSSSSGCCELFRVSPFDARRHYANAELFIGLPFFFIPPGSSLIPIRRSCLLLFSLPADLFCIFYGPSWNIFDPVRLVSYPPSHGPLTAVRKRRERRCSPPLDEFYTAVGSAPNFYFLLSFRANNFRLIPTQILGPREIQSFPLRHVRSPSSGWMQCGI